MTEDTGTPRTVRSGGGRWRILVHERLGRRRSGGVAYGTAHSIGSTPQMAGGDGEYRRAQVLPGTEFDELVVGRWLHVEQMSSSVWWMNVAGISINVTVSRDGKPQDVTLEEADPGDHPGCVYRFE